MIRLPVTADARTLLLDAVPLLVLAAVYLAVALALAAHVPALAVLARRRERHLVVTAGGRLLAAEREASECGREAE